MLDEPALADLMSPDFPIPPDQAIDLMSSGDGCGRRDGDRRHPLFGTVRSRHHARVRPRRHLGAGATPNSSTGPATSTDSSSDGGVIAWGVIPTTGPVATTAERYWRALSDLWCELVRRGCDPVALRRQSMVTPAGDLDRHSVSVARRIARLTAEVGKRVKDQANATRFALGA